MKNLQMERGSIQGKQLEYLKEMAFRVFGAESPLCSAESVQKFARLSLSDSARLFDEGIYEQRSLAKSKMEIAKMDDDFVTARAAQRVYYSLNTASYALSQLDGSECAKGRGFKSMSEKERQIARDDMDANLCFMPGDLAGPVPKMMLVMNVLSNTREEIGRYLENLVAEVSDENKSDFSEMINRQETLYQCVGARMTDILVNKKAPSLIS